nr:hypothetical protein [Clostridia bacterium]
GLSGSVITSLPEKRSAAPRIYINKDQIRETFLKAVNEAYSDHAGAINNLTYVLRVMGDPTFVEDDMKDLQQEMDYVAELLRRCIMQNADAAITEEEYERMQKKLTGRYEDLRGKYDALSEQKAAMEKVQTAIGGMLFEPQEMPDLPVSFSDSFWNAFVDHATVNTDDTITYQFRDGKEVTVSL